MRVVLLHQFPLSYGVVGRYVSDLGEALGNAGHEVRTLSVDHGVGVALPFGVPWFGTEPEGDLKFEELSSEQLATYRERLRWSLDQLVAEFDPQIIHSQHAWIWSHLALETGVPYVLHVWGPELISRARDERYRWLADQAVENAGRVFVSNDTTRRDLLSAFDDVAERTVLLPDTVDAATIRELDRHYRSVIHDRWGWDSDGRP